MSDEPTRPESEIAGLKQALADLDDRVARLEDLMRARERPAGPPTPDPEPVARVHAPGPPAPSPDEDEQPPSLAAAAEAAGANLGAGLIGGILLVLAGAYLLRALTESGAIPRPAGIACGLVYALAWAAFCNRMAARGRRAAASAACIASALVALPLVWEATVRFGILAPWTAAALLAAGGGLLLFFSERHRLALASAVTVLGIGGAAVALVFGTRHPEPFALVLASLGIFAAVRGPSRGGFLPWLCYLLADLGLLLLLAGSIGERAVAMPVPALLILVGSFVATLVVFAHQCGRSGQLGPQRAIQGMMVTLLGFGGGLLVAHTSLPGAVVALGAAGLVIGAAGYTLLQITVGWSRGHRWPFLYFSSLSLALVAMGAAAVFPQPSWVFAGLAVVLAVLGSSLDRVSPSLHAAVAVVLATLAGPLGRMIVHALGSPPDHPWPQPEPLAIATLAVACLCALLPLKDRSPLWPSWLPRLGRAAVILVAALGIAATVVQLAAPSLAGPPGGLDPGRLAALRTGVLAAMIALTAGVSGWGPLSPARRLVWPLLALLAIKLLAEDVRNGSALTMAIALLLYGVALIVATRRLRSLRRAPQPESAVRMP